MGVALLGGMAVATILGVFFYPMLFVVVGKVAKYEQKRELKTSNQTKKSDE
jgi:HAE1 family hydrophobic/amphiphilic exporter-1